MEASTLSSRLTQTPWLVTLQERTQSLAPCLLMLSPMHTTYPEPKPETSNLAGKKRWEYSLLNLVKVSSMVELMAKQET